MVTKEQALTCKRFRQVSFYGVAGVVSELPRPHSWRANGKCKVWKRDTSRFQLPIKHGLYSYGYIDETNCHLFEVEQ